MRPAAGPAAPAGHAAGSGGHRPPTVRVEHVSKCYHIYERPQDRLKHALWRGKRTFHREFWALKDVSLEVERGEALGILGRNGSGKSTLLQLVAGTLRPTAGNISVTGRIAALLELGSGFNPEFTGRENAILNGAILGFTRAQIESRMDDIAGFADIGEFLDQPVKTYSSGMLVRLAFAVQVQLDPDVLIIDEALAVGDSLFQKRCFERLEQLRNRGVSLLFVSHDQESIRTLTDRALLLHHGSPVASGTSAEVLLEYRKLLHAEENAYFAHATEAVRQRAEQARRARELATPETETRSDRLSFGGLEAEVLDVVVTDGRGGRQNHFHPGEPIEIRITCRVNRDMDRLNVAFRLRNKQGVKVTSWGTLNADIDAWNRGIARQATWERKFHAGEEFTAVFRGRVSLGRNLYEVQATITQEEHRYYGSQRILHWRDEAAFFNVSHRVDEYAFGGVCDMQLETGVEVVGTTGVAARAPESPGVSVG